MKQLTNAEVRTAPEGSIEKWEAFESWWGSDKDVIRKELVRDIWKEGWQAALEFARQEQIQDSSKASPDESPAVTNLEPIGHLFQHEETGRVQSVDMFQVRHNFAKNNPRWIDCGPVYSAAQVAALQAEAEKWKAYAAKLEARLNLLLAGLDNGGT